MIGKDIKELASNLTDYILGEIEQIEEEEMEKIIKEKMEELKKGEIDEKGFVEGAINNYIWETEEKKRGKDKRHTGTIY